MRGIGNGVSLIIFAGIVAALPQSLSQYFLTFTVADIPTLVGLVVLALAVTSGIVFVTEAERPVPITYARQAKMGHLMVLVLRRIFHFVLIRLAWFLSSLLFLSLFSHS